MATVRQQRAISYVLNDKMSVSSAMKKAGYSPSLVKNPQELTRSQAWMETMEKAGLTDDYLLKRHKELANSKKEEVAIRAIDLAYKVKGKYEQATSKNSFNAPVQIVINPPNDPPRIENTAKNKDI